MDRRAENTNQIVGRSMTGQEPPGGAAERRSQSLVVQEPLFRPEVIAARRTQWLGTVLLAPTISHALFAAFAALTIAAILSLLFFGEFTRMERITGWLVPEQGLVRVVAPQSGVITRLHVRDGDKVAKGAAIHDDVQDMPMGYQSLIGDMGTSLSGGQKQRLLIARALYRQTSLLLLDEATSHLDLRREKAVGIAINATDVTRIIVAHRPETIRTADRVIGLDNGKIVKDFQVVADSAGLPSAVKGYLGV